MLILGVCNSNDSGACLIRDGKIVAAVNEERFCRKKNVVKFPRESIDYVLESQKLTLGDIDWVGCGTGREMDEKVTLPRLVEDVIDQIQNGEPQTGEYVMERLRVTTSRDAKAKEALIANLESLKVPREKILFFDHHTSHAVTAFYCSPFEEAMVYTADCRGDFRSVTLWSASREKGLELLDMATELTSPGAMYGFVTKLLGFIPDRHEGKVTGLSAHGKLTDAYSILRSGFWFDPETGKIRSRIGSRYRPFVSAHWPELTERLSSFRREEIAFAAQKLLEETLIGFLMKHLSGKKEGSVNLCLAGGCMANVKLNYELSRLKPVKNIYVFPQMGDGGIALGGAISVELAKGKERYFELPTVYLGPDYDEIEILEVLQSQPLSFKRASPREKIERTIEWLVEGKIVGWFQGRMEYGPRALGARSILAPAVDPCITQNLNHRLKRSEFMPFAPVTIPSYAVKCFEGWQEDQRASKFMTTCYQCTPYLKEKCPAVVHVDDTARPQVVFPEDHPEYYEVIKGYIERTGNPALINTSFNHHEEPIVNTPLDAVRSFLRDNVDVLIIGDFIVDDHLGKKLESDTFSVSNISK